MTTMSDGESAMTAGWPLPEGVTARRIDGVNGLSMHVLEAGADGQRPLVLLLHGFPELSYSWRRVLPALAAAGWHAVAPDQRGYGLTTGWRGGYDDDLAPFRLPALVDDAVALVEALGHRSVAALVGHDFGAVVGAWAALLRPDVFRSVVLMSAPFAGPPTQAAAAGCSRCRLLPPALQPRLCNCRLCGRSPVDPRGARRAAATAEALSVVLRHPRRRCRHAARGAGPACVPARLLPHEERRLARQRPAAARRLDGRGTRSGCRPTT